MTQSQDVALDALAALQQRMELERLELTLGTYELEDMLTELRRLERQLDRNSTYLLPRRRRELKRRVRELRERIPARHEELAVLRSQVSSLGLWDD